MHYNISCFLIFLALLIITYVNGNEKYANKHGDWGYMNIDKNKQKSVLPEEWFKLTPGCNGTIQSPINIQFASTLFDIDMKYIAIEKNEDGGKSWNITNDGKTGNLIL